MATKAIKQNKTTWEETVYAIDETCKKLIVNIFREIREEMIPMNQLHDTF